MSFINYTLHCPAYLMIYYVTNNERHRYKHNNRPTHHWPVYESEKPPKNVVVMIQKSCVFSINKNSTIEHYKQRTIRLTDKADWGKRAPIERHTQEKNFCSECEWVGNFSRVETFKPFVCARFFWIYIFFQ